MRFARLGPGLPQSPFGAHTSRNPLLSSFPLSKDREGEGSKSRDKLKAQGSGAASSDSPGPASPTASQPNSRNSSVGDLLGMLLQSSYK